MAQTFESIIWLPVAIFFPLLILLHLYQNRNSSGFVTNWPIVGMLPGLASNAKRIIEYSFELVKHNGGTVDMKGPWFPKLDFLMTANHMNAIHILCKNFDNYEKGWEFKEIFTDFLGDGIFNSNSQLWKRQRKKMLMLLRHEKFVVHFHEVLCRKIEESLTKFLDHFVELGVEVDLQDVLQRFNYDISCMLAVGFDPNSLSIELPQIPCKSAFTQAEECLIYRHVMPIRLWKLQRWFGVGVEKRTAHAIEAIETFLYHCIATKREKLRCQLPAEEDDKHFDFITAFIADEDGDDEMSGTKKSDKLLRDIAVNIMAAGKDTISAGLSWFFWLIAMNRSVEAKILEEIRANSFTSTDDNDNYTMMFSSGERLNRFIYLDAVLCETLRLYPPVPINHKTAIAPDILPSGHRIRKNTRVLINFYAMGRMEEIWGEDCLEFKPERWISDRGDIVNAPSHKLIAFNAGPRSCIGRNISFAHMKLVAIYMVWKYQFQLVPGHHVCPSNAVVLHLKNGLKVRVKKRSD